MTDKEYVIYACKTFNFTLLKPTKECKDILVMQDIKGFMKCIAEGTTWKSIRTQLKGLTKALKKSLTMPLTCGVT